MIQPQQLRLGNYVTTALNDTPKKIISLEQLGAKNGIFYTIGLEGASRNVLKEHVYGIKLTEENLIKCGFVKEDTIIDWKYHLKINALKLYVRINEGQCYFEFGGIYLGDMIKYIHELQNFASSFGRELEINF